MLPRQRSDDRYGHAIRVGLALSLAGDVLLIPQGLFVAGLIAFLCAQRLLALSIAPRQSSRTSR